MSEELKPCPFCGHDAVLTSFWTEDGDARAIVCCKRISLSDGCASMYVERSSKRTAEMDVTDAWNRRAQ